MRPRRSLALLFAAAGGCMPAAPVFEGPRCDPRELLPGEMRVKLLACEDEEVVGGDGRRGDWLLENAVARVVVRNPAHAMTQLGVAGGTILDFTPPDLPDAIEEIVPDLGGGWFTDVEITPYVGPDAVGLDLVGTTAEGAERAVEYRLYPDDGVFHIDGVEGIVLVPPPESLPFGDFVEVRSEDRHGYTHVFAADGVLTDTGGWLRWDGVSAMVSGRPGRMVDLLPERWTVPVTGEADADWILAREPDGRTAVRIPVINGAFNGVAPNTAVDLIATAAGHTPSGPRPITDPGALEIGPDGFLNVHARTAGGDPLPVQILWSGETWSLIDGSGPLPVGPGPGTGWAWAGPAWEAAFLPEIDVQGEVDLDIVLRRAVTTTATLARFDVTAWPDADTRFGATRVLTAAAATGVQFAVTVADDEIPNSDPGALADRWLRSTSGTRTAAANGTIWSWDWYSNSRREAHGAVPHADLSAIDVLAVVDPGGNSRLTVVDTSWISAAGAPGEWAPSPAAIRLESLEDLHVYTELLDEWIALALTGPSTWLPGLDPRWSSQADVERALETRATVATTGPFINLHVDGVGPGGLVPERPQAPMLRLLVEAPTWMDVDTIALWGPGGVRLSTWDVRHVAGPRRLLVTMPAPDVDWILATASGAEPTPPMTHVAPWAATSAIFLARPQP